MNDLGYRGKISIWEGDTSTNMLRAEVMEQEAKFRRAMLKAHPQFKPKATQRAPRPVSAKRVRMLRGEDLSAEMAVRDKIAGRADFKTILQTVAEKARVTPAMICGRSRMREIVVARHAVWYLLSRGGYSNAAIARIFHVDATTVWHAVHSHRRRVKKLAPREVQLVETV